MHCVSNVSICLLCKQLAMNDMYGSDPVLHFALLSSLTASVTD